MSAMGRGRTQEARGAKSHQQRPAEEQGGLAVGHVAEVVEQGVDLPVCHRRAQPIEFSGRALEQTGRAMVALSVKNVGRAVDRLGHVMDELGRGLLASDHNFLGLPLCLVYEPLALGFGLLPRLFGGTVCFHLQFIFQIASL
jgi:hypothetical protein